MALVKHHAQLVVVFLAIVVFVPTIATAQDEVVYYHTDAIGSVRMVTDATGAVVARYDYAPFGTTVPTNPPNSNPDQRQFAGKERDTETNLDYFGARYYASQTGRFTTVDPALDQEKALVDPQQWNRYAYALNNPLKFVDPDGREPAITNRQLDFELPKWGYAVLGTAAVVGAGVLAGPTTWRAAVGCFLSPSCQSGTINLLEGAAGGTPTPLNPGRLLPALTTTTREALLEVAVAEGRGAVSEAGRALQSHAARAGSWLAGLAEGGNAAANTAAARRVLDEILRSGNVSFSKHKVWGDIMSVRLKDGRCRVDRGWRFHYLP
jgi:RHS repeat-associated protein